jgi:hypothetical protein
MRVDIYGLTFETPGVTFYLWTPWRASELEHKLFRALNGMPNVQYEAQADEQRIHINDAKTWRLAVQAIARVLKGWQEDAESGSEKRGWWWMIEADTNADGYDHTGEPTSLWGFIRLTLDRSNPGEDSKGEDIDLNGFGLRIAAERK